MKRKLFLAMFAALAAIASARAATDYPFKLLANATGDVDQVQFDPAQVSLTLTNTPGGGRRAIVNIIGALGGPGGTNIVLLAEPGVLLTPQGTGTNGIGADFSLVVSNGGFTINITGGSTGAVANGGSITIPAGGGLSADQTKALIASNATTFIPQQQFLMGYQEGPMTNNGLHGGPIDLANWTDGNGNAFQTFFGFDQYGWSYESNAMPSGITGYRLLGDSAGNIWSGGVLVGNLNNSGTLALAYASTVESARTNAIATNAVAGANLGAVSNNFLNANANTNFVNSTVAGATNQLLTAVPLRDNQYAAWQSLLGRLPVIPPGITVAHANNTSTAWGNDLVDAWASLLPFDYIVLNNPTNALINGYPCLLTTNMVMNFPAIQNVRAYVLNTTWWNVQDSNTSASWSVYFSSATNCALYGYPPFRGLTLVQEESTAFPTNDMAYPVYAGHSETNVYMCGVNAFDLRDAAPASDKVLVAVGTTGTNSCNFTVEDSAFGFGGATAVYPLCTNCMTVCPVAFHGSDPGADYVHNCIFYGQIGNNSFDPSYASPATLDNCYLYMPAIENGNGWTDPDAHRLGSIDTAENSNMFPAIVAPLVHIPTNYCADAQAPNFIPNSNAVANGQTNPVVLGGSLSASSLTATGNVMVGNSVNILNNLNVSSNVNAAVGNFGTVNATGPIIGTGMSSWPLTWNASGFGVTGWNVTFTNITTTSALFQHEWRDGGSGAAIQWLGQRSNHPNVFYLSYGASPTTNEQTSIPIGAFYVSTNSGATWMTNTAAGWTTCSNCGSISDAGSGDFNESIPGPVAMPFGATGPGGTSFVTSGITNAPGNTGTPAFYISVTSTNGQQGEIPVYQ